MSCVTYTSHAMALDQHTLTALGKRRLTCLILQSVAALPEKKTLGSSSFKHTKSGGGELFLLFCRANALLKGKLFSQTPVSRAPRRTRRAQSAGWVLGGAGGLTRWQAPQHGPNWALLLKGQKGWGAVWAKSGHLAQYYYDMLSVRLGVGEGRRCDTAQIMGFRYVMGFSGGFVGPPYLGTPSL